MIKQTLFIALAANFVWMLPIYRRYTIERRDELLKKYIQRAMNGGDYIKLKLPFLSNKPFTCLYCITFWLGLIYGAISIILSFAPQNKVGFVNYNEILGVCGAVIIAPVVSVIIERWFNSLPVKL